MTIPPPPQLDGEHLEALIRKLKREKLEHNMIIAMGGGLFVAAVVRWLGVNEDLQVGTGIGWCLGVIAKHIGL